MGRVTILDHNGHIEEADHSGPFIDYLLVRFPDGFEGKSVLVQVNGYEVETADFDIEIGPQDKVLIRISPAGVGLIVGIISAVSAVASLAFSLLALGRVDQSSQEQTSSPYSVDVRANRAELGAVIPVRYGTTIDTPHFASQSYRFFENHQETRILLLTLGAGFYRADDILIGDTPINQLPAGTADFDVYTPDDHMGLAGIIAEDFDIEENVSTSGAVDNQELRERTPLEGSTRGSRVRVIANDQLFFERARDLPNGSIRSGDTLVITTPASLVGSYPIVDVSEDTITINGNFGVRFGEIDSRLRYTVEAANSGNAGPFPANPPGSLINRIEYDVEMPTGQQIGEDQTLAVLFILTVQQIDDDGNAIGAPFVRERVEEDATTEYRRYTISEDVPDGRYQVSLRVEFGRQQVLNSNFQVIDAPLTANDRTVTNWTGLKGYILQPEGTPSFQGQTILALRLQGSQELSAGSQTRVFVRTTSLLKSLETGERIPTGNPADIIADIWTNSVYSAGQPETSLDMETLMQLRETATGLPGWNGVLDEATSIQDALVSVLEPYQARPYRRRNSLGILFDNIKPVRRALVLPETRLIDSLRATFNWVSEGDQDGIEVRYRDARDFEELQAQWPPAEDDPRRFVENDLPPAPINVRGFEVRGITDDLQAEAHARYLYNTRIKRNTDIQFTVELEGLNWEPFDRLGVVSPDFNWGEGREILAIGPDYVDVDGPVEAGAYTVSFRQRDGSATDSISALSDGTERVTISGAMPTNLAPVGDNWPPLMAIVPRADAIQDVLVTSIQPNGRRAQVTCVNYDPDAPTLEDLRNVS